MKRWIPVALLILFLLATPVFGLEYLKKDDLKITIEGKKDCYSPGDHVAIKITIQPKNDDIAKSMVRDYTFYNYLMSPREMKITPYTAETPEESPVHFTVTTSDKSYTLHSQEINLGYVKKIVINVTGYVPTNLNSNVGIIEFTFFKVVPQDGDTILFNITIVNPSKLEEELKNIENELKNIKNEIDELGKYVNVESLNERYEKISSNLTLAKGYYNDKEYDKVSEKISWIKKAISDLEAKLKEKKADYYLSEAENIINDIDALILKADSYITVAKNSGKANEVINFEINLTQIKYKFNDLKDDLKNIQKLYDEGKYDDVIDNAKDLVNRAKNVKLQLSIIVSKLQNIISTKETPTPTKTAGFNFKLDKKTLTYIGIGVAVIIGGSVAAVAISKWRQKRKWDELR